jgi:hypothetical protein
MKEIARPKPGECFLVSTVASGAPLAICRLEESQHAEGRTEERVSRPIFRWKFNRPREAVSNQEAVGAIARTLHVSVGGDASRSCHFQRSHAVVPPVAEVQTSLSGSGLCKGSKFFALECDGRLLTMG